MRRLGTCGERFGAESAEVRGGSRSVASTIGFLAGLFFELNKKLLALFDQLIHARAEFFAFFVPELGAQVEDIGVDFDDLGGGSHFGASSRGSARKFRFKAG